MANQQYDLQILITGAAQGAIKAFQDVSKSLRQIAKEMGIVSAATTAFKSASLAVTNLSKGLDSFSRQAKKFGREFTTNVTLPLAALAGLSLKKVFDEAYFGRGSAVANQFGGAIQALKKDFDALLITIGTQLAPIATRVVNFFRGLIAAYQSLSPATKELIMNFGLIAGAVGPIVLAISAFTGIIAKLLAILGPVISFGAKLLAFFASPLGAAVALGVAVAGLTNIFLKLKQAGATTGEALIEVFRLVVDFYQKYVTGNILKLTNKMIGAIGSFVGLFTDKFQDAFKTVQGFIQESIDYVDNNFENTKSRIDSKLGEIGTSAGEAFTFGLSTSIEKAAMSFDNFTTRATPTIETFAQEVKQRAEQIGMMFSSNLSDAFLDFAEGTKTAEQAFRDFARQTIRMLTQMILQAQIFNSLFAGGGPGAGVASGAARLSQPAQFAAGGLVTGPGTGTSDSILARLSNGEFVVNANTVRTFGASFFHGLQSLAKNGVATRKRGPLPAFADGGLVGTGGNAPQVVIQNSGTPKEATSTSFDPSTAVTTVVLEDLQKNGSISKSIQRTFGMRRGGFR